MVKKERKEKQNQMPLPLRIPQQVLHQMADLVASAVVARIPRDVFRRGRKKPKSNKLENPLVLDTSAIIDGRVYDVAKLGFLMGTVVVPNFILLELKHVADSQDSLKRARGRRGLELLDKMRKIKGIKFHVFEADETSREEADERLTTLTKKLKGRLITCDFNLNKKASVEGVRVLNINELVNVLKTVALPGEELSVSLVSPGKGKNQGVGYLSDGTMVVVEDGVLQIGNEVAVNVSRIFQTAAGRMIFAKLKNG